VVRGSLLKTTQTNYYQLGGCLSSRNRGSCSHSPLLESVRSVDAEPIFTIPWHYLYARTRRTPTLVLLISEIALVGASSFSTRFAIASLAAMFVDLESVWTSRQTENSRTPLSWLGVAYTTAKNNLQSNNCTIH